MGKKTKVGPKRVRRRVQRTNLRAAGIRTHGNKSLTPAEPRKKSVLLSQAYVAVLETKYPRSQVTARINDLVQEFAGDGDITYAEHIAIMMAFMSGRGDIVAAKEIRAATEGDDEDKTGASVMVVIDK